MTKTKKRKVTDIGPFFELKEGDIVQACGPIFEGITCLGVVQEVLEDGLGRIEWEQRKFKRENGFMIIGDIRRPEGLHLVERPGEDDLAGLDDKLIAPNKSYSQEELR